MPSVVRVGLQAALIFVGLFSVRLTALIFVGFFLFRWLRRFSLGSSWFVGYVYLRWVLLGGCLALLLCAGVRCESWYVSCVDFRWAATGSLAALIFVGFFKLRWFSLGCSRHFCFALASIARVGLQGALVFVRLFSVCWLR